MATFTDRHHNLIDTEWTGTQYIEHYEDNTLPSKPPKRLPGGFLTICNKRTHVRSNQPEACRARQASLMSKTIFLNLPKGGMPWIG